MDAVEELNGTYFYAGKVNLAASELLFMIFCENTASQLGIGVAENCLFTAGQSHGWRILNV